MSASRESGWQKGLLVNRKVLDLLMCPRCQATDLAIEETATEGARVMSGHLACPACNSRWPIVEGVPRFVSADNYARSFGAEWKLFSRTQLDSHTGTTISRDRFVEVTQVQPAQLAGKTVLECGCGMGRFLEVVAREGAEVVGIDFSVAVESAFQNLRDYPNVTIIQADLFNLPLKFEAFDLVYSIGVLHHTPSTRQALEAVGRHVRPGGALAAWVYHRHAFVKPHHLYHYVFRRLRPETALRLVRWYHPVPWFLRRIPIVGKALAAPLPISDYRGKLPLTAEQQLEWSYLDTIDKMTPWYIWRHTPDEVRSWGEELGYEDIQVGRVPCSITMRRPQRPAPSPPPANR